MSRDYDLKAESLKAAHKLSADAIEQAIVDLHHTVLEVDKKTDRELQGAIEKHMERFLKTHRSKQGDCDLSLGD